MAAPLSSQVGLLSMVLFTFFVLTFFTLHNPADLHTRQEVRKHQSYYLLEDQLEEARGSQPSKKSAGRSRWRRRRHGHSAASGAARALPVLVPTNSSEDSCVLNATYMEHTEFWGGVVQNGDQNSAPSARACCEACRDYEPTIEINEGHACNAFVWNPTTHACWLKNSRQEHLAHPGRGERVPWTSGVYAGPTRPCDDCTLPSTYYGCVSKTLCNTTRECGSPAIDGYSHVDTGCLERSRDARVYLDLISRGVKLAPFAESGADYDGLGVRWGIGHKKANWSECEAACIAHRPTPSGGPFHALPCNVWTWCGRETCWEPDAHKHSFGDCWLKFSEQPEAPEVNMRMPMSRPYMRRHGKEMRDGVPWVSGVLLEPGVQLRNGTWGPRAFW